MIYRFEIFKGTNSQYYWRFKAPNGEIMCQSEGYISKQSAQHAINVLKQQASTAPIHDLVNA